MINKRVKSSERERESNSYTNLKTLPTGTISMNDVRNELGLSGPISLGQNEVRSLAGINDGKISLNDLKGKSNKSYCDIIYHIIYNDKDITVKQEIYENTYFLSESDLLSQLNDDRYYQLIPYLHDTKNDFPTIIPPQYMDEYFCYDNIYSYYDSTLYSLSDYLDLDFFTEGNTYNYYIFALTSFLEIFEERTDFDGTEIREYFYYFYYPNSTIDWNSINNFFYSKIKNGYITCKELGFNRKYFKTINELPKMIGKYNIYINIGDLA